METDNGIVIVETVGTIYSRQVCVILGYQRRDRFRRRLTLPRLPIAALRGGRALQRIKETALPIVRQPVQQVPEFAGCSNHVDRFCHRARL